MTTEALEAAIAQHFSEDARAAYEWQLKYNTYLASEAWQHKRLQKLLSLVGITAHSYESIDWLALQASRFLYCCETCGSKASHAELQVHHRHHRNLGNEPLHDLVVLCGFCHQALQKVVRATDLPAEVVTEHLVGPTRASGPLDHGRHQPQAEHQARLRSAAARPATLEALFGTL